MAEKKVPLRKCIGCGESKGKKELIRIVKTKEGEICLDETGRKNGRGAYLCKNNECLKKVKKTKGLDRSFKMAVSAEVYDLLEKEFVKFESAQ